MKNKLNELLKLYEKKLKYYNQKNKYYISIRTMIFVLFVLLIIAGMKIPAIDSYFMILFFILLISFFIICIKHQKIKQYQENYQTSIAVVNEYFKRINDTWNDFKDTGIDLKDDNYILSDLDIIGENSLFQYLNIGKSEGGRKRLLERLSNPLIPDLINEQNAVKELKEDLEFAIQFQVKSKKIKGNLIKEIERLNNDTSSHKITLIIHSLLSIITLTFGVLSLFNILDTAFFSLSAILQLSYSIIIDKINTKEFEDIKATSSSFAYIYPVFQLINEYTFTSHKMKTIAENIHKGERIIQCLNKIYDFDTFRYHFLGYVLGNTLFPLNSYILYSFHKVTSQSFEDLKISMIHFEDLESLISLSVLGVCKENVSMPKLSNNIELVFDDIRHPLLKEDICISNSFQCKDNINIITGSNMSGKTSFMRTVALNMILMNAGGYVNASLFRAPYLKMFTSMRVSDDLDKGISTFYGELLRIKDMIDYKNTQQPFIVFIDEIFKGTNYNDRIYGAKEVINNIALDSSILFITTHDFELCDINNKKINNYYFEEYYEENRIKFDYKIKAGKCKTTNARFLMKQLNII